VPSSQIDQPSHKKILQKQTPVELHLLQSEMLAGGVCCWLLEPLSTLYFAAANVVGGISLSITLDGGGQTEKNKKTFERL